MKRELEWIANFWPFPTLLGKISFIFTKAHKVYLFFSSLPCSIRVAQELEKPFARHNLRYHGIHVSHVVLIFISKGD